VDCGSVFIEDFVLHSKRKVIGIGVAYKFMWGRGWISPANQQMLPKKEEYMMKKMRFMSKLFLD